MGQQADPLLALGTLQGESSWGNKPPLSYYTVNQFSFIWQVLDRRYKKNLKTFFIVHPTNFIRVVYNFFKPIIRLESKKLIIL